MGNIINRVFESAGPDGKVRGTPQQIIDKYQALARDAQVAGDRVAAESYLQHSEHYSRLLGEAQRQQVENRFQPGARGRPAQRGGDDGQQQRPRQPAARRSRRWRPVGSGLTMIEPDDSYDMAGPIETPEGAARRRVDDAGAGGADGRRAPQPAAGSGVPSRAGQTAAGYGQAPSRRRRRGGGGAAGEALAAAAPAEGRGRPSGRGGAAQAE